MRRRVLLGAAPAALAVLAGCATPSRPSAPAAAFWSGRLGLQVEGRPADSLSALFELQGSPRAGELTLTSAIGSGLAVLSWRPGQATLQAGGQTRQFASVDELAAQATGTAIPVAALFDWLAGVATAVPGWQPDLSQLPQGRLAARRVEPAPAADLRIVLER